MPTFYLDYENGDDANSGADWANLKYHYRNSFPVLYTYSQ